MAERQQPGAARRPGLLTEAEAAEHMGWKRTKVQWLRLSGKLPYYPGRPPLIELADLEGLEVTRNALAAPPSPPIDPDAAVRARARAKWLARSFRRLDKTKRTD